MDRSAKLSSVKNTSPCQITKSLCCQNRQQKNKKQPEEEIRNRGVLSLLGPRPTVPKFRFTRLWRQLTGEMNVVTLVFRACLLLQRVHICILCTSVCVNLEPGVEGAYRYRRERQKQEQRPLRQRMQEWVGLWLRRQKGTGRRKHRRATIQGMEHARVQGQRRSRSRCIWLSARLACTWNADKAWQLMNQLAEEGARLGCHHCQRVMANCNWWSHGCKHDAARSLESALESSVNGSRFGLCTHGVLHESDVRGRAQDYAQAVVFYKFPG